MWLLVLVLVFHPVNWPLDQPRPMMEYVIEYGSRDECIAARNWWAENGEEQPAGVSDEWAVLAMECEPGEYLSAGLTAPSLSR